MERVQNVLPPRRAALEHDERHIDEIGQREAALPQQPMAGRRDEPPVEREEMAVLEPAAPLIRRGHAEREIGIA